MVRSAEVVIIGAGIAGVSTAYQLAVTHGIKDVVIIDARPPLTLTSDKSTESYRNWWPDAPMVAIMNRSIDILDQLAEVSGNAFGLSRRGYLFVTEDPASLAAMTKQAEQTSLHGGGQVRTHPADASHKDPVDGVDILDGDHLGDHFPYITPDAVGGLLVRRAGWFDAQQLGSWMLDRARDHGATLVKEKAAGIEVEADAVTGVVLADGTTIATGSVVDAAGPMAGQVAQLVGVDLPLFSELHFKVVFKDHLGAVPRDAPMIIWSDPQRIDWSEDERAGLAGHRDDLLGDLPAFAHGRPEGGEDSPYVVGLWEYNKQVLEPVWPLPVDDFYAEVVIRGLARMIPGLDAYRTGLPESSVDGGYYTKTKENRPLIGPCGPDGFHVIVGLSGFGVMIAAGAASLAAQHIVGESLAPYAGAFLLSRYEDPLYLAGLESSQAGQI